MKKETIYNLIAFSGIIVSILLIVISWGTLPQDIPAHFGIDGTADSFAPKGSIFLFPTIMLLLYFLLGLMLIKRPWMVKNYPYKITEENKQAHYAIIKPMGYWLRVSIIWTFVFIEYLLIDYVTEKGKISGFTALIPIAAVIIVTILIMRKGKKNHIKAC